MDSRFKGQGDPLPRRTVSQRDQSNAQRLEYTRRFDAEIAATHIEEDCKRRGIEPLLVNRALRGVMLTFEDYWVLLGRQE